MRKRLLQGATATFTALAMAFLLATNAQAQDIPQEQAPPDTDVAQEELETFAEIYVDVDEVRAELEAEMAAADSPEEAQQVQQQANETMTQIVEGHGMSIERYTEITQALNADPELHDEFQSILGQIDGLL